MLERNDKYWGPKPALARVTIEIVKDTSARVAAIQSGQADLTLNVPVREVQRFQSEGGFTAELNPDHARHSAQRARRSRIFR